MMHTFSRAWIQIPHDWRAVALLCLFALFGSAVQAASIRVAPDRNPVSLNESFNLVFTATEKPDDDPDFSPLEKDFKILSQGQSSQMSIDNGHFSRTTEWTLTLMPKQAGTFTLPPIAFGSDRSEQAVITVQAGTEEAPAESTAPREVLLEVQAEPRNPYVQAQVRYTVRVLRRVNFNGAELSEPVVHDALVERLGEDRGYQAERGGQQYAVIERQYVIFPQKSGPLRIEPLTLEAQIPTGGRSRFNSFFGMGSRVVRAQSKAVELNVRPIPAGFTGRHWLPAESLELMETWSQTPPRTEAGEPITRTLALRAKGATVGVLPELAPNLERAIGDQAKLYPDQPAMNEEKRPDGIISSRQEKTALLPGRAGKITLPAIEIPWWNTRSDRMEVARLPEQTLIVTGAAGEPAPTAPPAAEPEPAEAIPAVSQKPDAANLAVPAAPLTADPWFWSTLVAAIGWLLTALFWLRARQSPASLLKDGGQAELPGLRAATRAVKEACRSGDPARARDALLVWAAARWPTDAPSSLAALARRSGGGLAQAIAELERALYSRSGSCWNGETLGRLIAEPQTGDAQTQKAPDLEPLYRS